MLKYANNMQIYAKLEKYAGIASNMQVICNKYSNI